MDINTALSLFEFEDITKVDIDMLHKRYRKLMKKNHPDIGGSDEAAKNINDANQVLLRAINEIKKASIPSIDGNPTIFINFGSLIKIYGGESIKVGGNGNTIDVTRGNINRFHTMLNIGIKIIVNGIEYQFDKFELKNVTDNYSIVCKYFVANLDDDVNIRILAYSKDIALNVKDTRLNMNLTFDYGVKLKVMLERQLVKDE